MKLEYIFLETMIVILSEAGTFVVEDCSLSPVDCTVGPFCGERSNDPKGIIMSFMY